MSRAKKLAAPAGAATYPSNAFIGRTDVPSDDALTAALGPAKPVWDSLLAKLATAYDVADHEWKSYSPKHGWALRATRKGRTIIWLSAAEECFTASFILGEKALVAARAAQLPSRIVDIMATAPKYPEGTGVRVVVKSARDLPALVKLAGIKVAN